MREKGINNDTPILSQKEKRFRWFMANRCSWKRDIRQCQMMGSFSASGEKGTFFCGWHDNCLDNPKMAEDIKEFTRWLEAHQKTSIANCYKNDEWMQNRDDIWDMLQGISDKRFGGLHDNNGG